MSYYLWLFTVMPVRSIITIKIDDDRPRNTNIVQHLVRMLNRAMNGVIRPIAKIKMIVRAVTPERNSNSIRKYIKAPNVTIYNNLDIVLEDLFVLLPIQKALV